VRSELRDSRTERSPDYRGARRWSIGTTEVWRKIVDPNGFCLGNPTSNHNRGSLGIDAHVFVPGVEDRVVGERQLRRDTHRGREVACR
jgi:hypothetical protein